MNLFKKTFLAFLLITFCLTTPKAMAEDSLAHTIKSAIYGGALGGIISGAVILITDNPGDHLAFIPTGVGAGILLGTAYGVITSDAAQGRAFGEIEGGKLNFNIPTVKTSSTFDKKTRISEMVGSLDLMKIHF